jgi:hypothetical protein
MPLGWRELKRKLEEATERRRLATNPEERDLLGRDVRELERLVEIAATQDPDMPQ